MSTRQQLLYTVHYLAIALMTFLALQALTVVVHEFTHSTMAWLLGDLPSPLDIVWGNPLTMTGWDEGVDYDRIFSQGRFLQGAVIGFCPLVMHTGVVGLGILFMRGQRLRQYRWLYHATYWCVVASFMELVAYVYMRAFSGHGDIGIFNRGTGLSPWWVFILGSTLLTWGLFIFYRHALPGLQALFARKNLSSQWMMLILTSFIIFLWGSGIRVMLYVPDSQWLFGLMGAPAFVLAVWFFRPGLIQAEAP